MSANFKNYSVLQVLPHLDSGGLVSGAIEISKALTEKKLGSYKIKTFSPFSFFYFSFC